MAVSSSIESLLHSLVTSQQEESQTWPSQLPSLESMKNILRSFQATPIFRQRYVEAFRFHLKPHSDQEIKDFRSRFAGALFDGVGLIYEASTLSPSQLILFPDRPLNFYRGLYPSSPIMKHPLGQASLKGITVPDGMVIEENGRHQPILAVCECTLSGDRENYKDHYQGFMLGRRRYPTLFNDTSLIFITPKEAHLQSHIERDDKVKLVELPFSREQFRDYVNGIYEFYKIDKDSATLLEAQTWARGQLKRAPLYRDRRLNKGKSG